MRASMPGRRPKPDRSLALAQYRQRAPIYDRELLAFEPIRSDAVRGLRLAPGQTVLDVACGTGLSFELLQARVGAQGRIVGIDQCPEMLAIARERVARHGWHNVELIEAPAASARIEPQADAALFHFTHDVLREDAAIDNVLAHLARGARVVATGLQWAPPWMWATNGFVLLAAMHSVTSFDGLACPWDRLAAHLDDVHVDTALLGGIYVMSGQVRVRS
ncbi:MAG TPA: methyltransferase domain-containing protein [Ramlibacter sp.]|uniref:class I SAM-dependent methyltransferase n=1 Tax=Ramlibacter sp. TaxID=1917967 RepID=UPI002CCF6C76|nr:methyltransferase domain-containing protein [Ramlibacter sp.]HVZ44721.1 methyltransferase domain-containing protein [Ramlibacter sp.]